MIWPHSDVTIDPVVRLAQVAEDTGFDTVYVGDSQMLWNDVWITLAACALGTKRVRLGPGVTPILSRHPAVTANAAVSLNMLSNGRAVLGLAAGDSALRTIGVSPTPLALLKEVVPKIKALMTGEEVDVIEWYDPRPEKAWGVESRMQMAAPAGWQKPVPIEWAVLRPQAAEAAGEIADGVIVTGGLGNNPEGAKVAVESIATGARRAGRDPAELRVICATEAAIDDDREKAIDQVRPTAARLVANVGWLPDSIKVEHADSIAKIKEGYSFYEHLDLTARHRELIPDELAQKVCITGNAEDCITKCRQLEEAGVTDIAIFATSQDEEGGRRTLEKFAREVIPHV
jgi:5,10-methylenetetrahydromethanopterin reductase